jgi:hypothetical protein
MSKPKMGDLVRPTSPYAFLSLGPYAFLSLDHYERFAYQVLYPKCQKVSFLDEKGNEIKPNAYPVVAVDKERVIVETPNKNLIVLRVNHVEVVSPPEPPKEEPAVPTETTPAVKTSSVTHPPRFSFYAIERGMKRPAIYTFQLAANEVAKRLGRADMKVGVDGVAGGEYDRVARIVQREDGRTPDGKLGSSWTALTKHIPDWRPPLRLRIGELECTYESGRRGFDYGGKHTIIPSEGWPNYGIWNVNWQRQWGQSFKGSSLGEMLRLGRASHLQQYEPDESDRIAYWFGSKKGRETQIGIYFDKHILGPALDHLRFLELLPAEATPDKFGLLERTDFERTLSGSQELAIAVACDIVVNSGAYGFWPKKSPRQWDGEGSQAWPDWLPDKEVVKEVYTRHFGTIKSDTSYVTSDTRDTYRAALREAMGICEDLAQQTALIAELQGRCIVDRWRKMILQRRRSISVPGYNDGFQGSDYEPVEHFGIGV